MNTPSSARAPSLSLVGVVALISWSGCTDPVTPEFEHPYPHLTLRTEVAPAEAAAGDSVTLRAILGNPTLRTTEVGAGCGPPALFAIRSPAGSTIYPIPLDAVFTCPLLDYHVLEPGETDTVTVRWKVPGPTGVYVVQSGFRGPGGLQRLTAPVYLTVR